MRHFPADDFRMVCDSAFSDGKGEVRLEGVPLGSYRWRLEGSSSSGDVSLSDGTTIDLLAVE